MNPGNRTSFDLHLKGSFCVYTFAFFKWWTLGKKNIASAPFHLTVIIYSMPTKSESDTLGDDSW